VATVVFKHMGDGLLLAIGKGFLVALAFTIVLSIILWISS
jgi:hypothetical protein